MSDETTLADLLQLNLHRFEDEVRNIVDKAVKESGMEKVGFFFFFRKCVVCGMVPKRPTSPAPTSISFHMGSGGRLTRKQSLAGFPLTDG